MMTYCIELVLFGHTLIESWTTTRELCREHMGNLGSDQAKVYQTRVKQLGSYTADLRNLEGTSLVETAQLVLSKLYAEQKYLFEEAEKEIAERTRHLGDNRASYQSLSNDLQKLEFNAKSA